MEPPPSATLGCRPYKDRLVAGPRGIVCEAGFEPATSRLSTWRLYRLGYKHVEPSPGADPGRPPYESGVTAVCDGIAASPGLEPRFSASGAAVLPLDEEASVGEEGVEPSHDPS